MEELVKKSGPRSPFQKELPKKELVKKKEYPIPAKKKGIRIP